MAPVLVLTLGIFLEGLPWSIISGYRDSYSHDNRASGCYFELTRLRPDSISYPDPVAITLLIDTNPAPAPPPTWITSTIYLQTTVYSVWTRLFGNWRSTGWFKYRSFTNDSELGEVLFVELRLPPITNQAPRYYTPGIIPHGPDSWVLRSYTGDC